MTESTEIIFALTLEDLQQEAFEAIGRHLTLDEIRIAKKALESGLLTDIATVYNTIFKEMI